MNYNELSEIIVKNQEELDTIPLNFKGKIYIDCKTTVQVKNRYNWRVEARGNSSVVAWGNSSVEAWGNSSVVAWGNSSVEAWGNSSVEARGNSSVVARGNSSVVAWGNSSVEAWGNSSVEAWENSSVVARENSSVEARGNSSVEARGNSSVEAWGNSSVEAWGNVRVINRQIKSKIQIHCNARIVYMPKTIYEFMDFYGIKHDKSKAIFYKSVRKNKGEFISDADINFKYVIGETKLELNCNMDVEKNCGKGIHISDLAWALDYGNNWDDLAIIEVEADIDKIVLPKCTDGKVRTSEIKVLREVPLEECGLRGKFLAKHISKAQTN